MSKKIKTVYDLDPTAGDDETTNWLVPADDDANNPVTLDKTQVSNAVATVGAVREIDERVSGLETGTPPPDPVDPPPAPTWAATLNANKLIADVSVYNYTVKAGAAYILVADSDVVPTDDAVVGVSPPTGFTPGQWPNTYDVVTFTNAKDLYFYQYDDVDGIVLAVSQQDGTDSITLVPVDTLAPVFPSSALVNLSSELSALDQETKVKFFLASAVDPVPG